MSTDELILAVIIAVVFACAVSEFVGWLYDKLMRGGR